MNKAIVTGGTRGIGLAIARALLADGASVIITGREQTKLDQAIAVIRRSGGGTVRGVVADAAATEGAADLLKAAPEVDVLINNLGIYEIKPFGEITDDDWRRYFEINVLSGARLARQYFPGMLKRNWGRIVFMPANPAWSRPARWSTMA